jgi:thiol-disulfide isomerase/thioredoxin
MLRSIAPFLFAMAALAAESGDQTIRFPLTKKLLPDPLLEVAELHPVAGLPDGLRAYSTELPFGKGAKVRVAVIERDGVKPVWLVDKNLDGEVSPDEQVEVGEIPTVIEFPLKGEPFPSFPIQLKAVQLPPKWQEDMIRRNIRLVYYSHAVDISGTVKLDGIPYDFFYRISSNTFAAPSTQVWVAADLNHDGKIDQERWSEEIMFGESQPVFRLGNRYFRAETPDTSVMTAAIREVPAAEYRIISLRPGRAVPDFPFTDLAGTPQTLKGERGQRYTMLYFWASWCAICQSEIALFEQAGQKYEDQGFRVIGINGDKDAALARKFLKEHNVTFPQASWDSVQDLVERRLRIEDWPTAVLLDADFRVISTNTAGELHIRQEGLMSTLEGLFSGRLDPAAPVDTKRNDDPRSSKGHR